MRTEDEAYDDDGDRERRLFGDDEDMNGGYPSGLIDYLDQQALLYSEKPGDDAPDNRDPADYRPELRYEGFIKAADGSIISIQCSEGRCAECPDTSTADDSRQLNGYACEHGCAHGPANTRPDPHADGRTVTDDVALNRIQEMLRDPEWGTGMLEDIADIIRATDRAVDDYPDQRPTWGRH